MHTWTHNGTFAWTLVSATSKETHRDSTHSYPCHHILRTQTEARIPRLLCATSVDSAIGGGGEASPAPSAEGCAVRGGQTTPRHCHPHTQETEAGMAWAQAEAGPGPHGRSLHRSRTGASEDKGRRPGHRHSPVASSLPPPPSARPESHLYRPCAKSGVAPSKPKQQHQGRRPGPRPVSSGDPAMLPPASRAPDGRTDWQVRSA